MNMAHLQQLDRAVRLASRPRALKLLSQPTHLVRSKIFEFMARRNQSGIETVAQTFWAHPIRVVLPERVSMTIFRYGFFEAELSGAFIQILKPGMVFLDIGAHIGYFSLAGVGIGRSTGAGSYLRADANDLFHSDRKTLGLNPTSLS